MIDNTSNPAIEQQLRSSIKRHDIINSLIAKHNFASYLEIGIFDGYTFNRVNCSLKHGVDPGAEGMLVSQVTHRMTSDDFFEICDTTYDIIFIDGLHEYKQVIKDFNNSIKVINKNGYILLHDCNPPDEISQTVPRRSISWNGDVWKAFILIKRENPNASVIDSDFGIGLVPAQNLHSVQNIENFQIEWQEFDQNRSEFLGLVSVEEITI
jgi:hypothetical protein